MMSGTPLISTYLSIQIVVSVTEEAEFGTGLIRLQEHAKHCK